MWHQFWRLFSHHISNTQFSFGLFSLFFIAIVFFCRITIFTWYRSLLFYGNKYVSRCCVTLFKDEFMNECNDEMPSLKFPWKCFVYSLAIYSKNWKWCTPFMDFYFRYIFLSLLGSPSYTCKSRTWTKWFVRRLLFTPFMYFFFYFWMRYNRNSIHSFIHFSKTNMWNVPNIQIFPVKYYFFPHLVMLLLLMWNVWIILFYRVGLIFSLSLSSFLFYIFL